MFKNQASQKIALFAFITATGTPKTGDAANLTAYVSKDYGTVTVLGDTSATEMDATNAPGWYLFDLTQAETNGDELLFTGKSSTSGVTVVGRPVTTVPIRFTTLAIDAAGLADANTVKVEGADATNTIRDSANMADALQRLVTMLEPAGGSPNEFRFSVDALRHMPTLIWGAERANFTAAGSFGQYVPANVTFFGGVAGTFAAGRPEVNTTHAAGTAWNSGAIGASTLAADTITAGKIAADAIGASELAADAVAEIQSGLATAANLAIVAGYIDTEVASIKAKTDNLPSDPADASDIAAAFATVNATLTTIDGRIDAEIPQIKQVTDKLHSMLEAATGSPGESRFTSDALRNAPAGGGGVSAPTAAEIADAVWEEAVIDHVGVSGSAADLLFGTYSGVSELSLSAIATAVWTADDSAYLGGAYADSFGQRLRIEARTIAELATMLEPASGSPGDYKFTPDALRAIISVVPTAIENADALLNRDMSAVDDTTARSPLNALRFLRNKWSISGATLTVTKENDLTAAWTATVSTTAGADPVTGNDPA